MRATWLPSNEPCKPEELRAEGIEHERFTYKYQGLDFRLTGVEKARVVREVLV